MIRRIFPALVIAACMAFGALVALPHAADASRDKGGKVEGTVTVVNTATNSISIQRRSGTTVTLTVGANTKIERNDKKATLADVLVGDRAEAKYNANTLVASKLEVDTHHGD